MSNPIQLSILSRLSIYPNSLWTLILVCQLMYLPWSQACHFPPSPKPEFLRMIGNHLCLVFTCLFKYLGSPWKSQPVWPQRTFIRDGGFPAGFPMFLLSYTTADKSQLYLNQRTNCHCLGHCLNCLATRTGGIQILVVIVKRWTIFTSLVLLLHGSFQLKYFLHSWSMIQAFNVHIIIFMTLHTTR